MFSLFTTLAAFDDEVLPNGKAKDKINPTVINSFFIFPCLI
jgi:hypothetical protein